MHFLVRILFVVFCVLGLLPDAYAQKKITDEEKVDYMLERLDTNAAQSLFEEMTIDLVLMQEIAFPQLLDIARDEDESEIRRINAMYIIGRMGEYGSPAVATLVKALSDPRSSDDIKAAAAGALGRIGRKAEAAIPALQNHLSHANSFVRDQAERALKTIGTKKSRVALEEHKAYLKDLEAQKALLEDAEQQDEKKSEKEDKSK